MMVIQLFLRHARLRYHLFGQANPLFGRYPSPVGCLSLARLSELRWLATSRNGKFLFGQSRLELDHFIRMFRTKFVCVCVFYAISGIELYKIVTWILLSIQKFKSLLDFQGNVLHFSWFFSAFLFHLKHLLFSRDISSTHRLPPSCWHRTVSCRSKRDKDHRSSATAAKAYYTMGLQGDIFLIFISSSGCQWRVRQGLKRHEWTCLS